MYISNLFRLFQVNAGGWPDIKSIARYSCKVLLGKEVFVPMDFFTQLESTLGFAQISKSNCKLLGNKSSNGLVSGGANDQLELTPGHMQSCRNLQATALCWWWTRNWYARAITKASEARIFGDLKKDPFCWLIFSFLALWSSSKQTMGSLFF